MARPTGASVLVLEPSVYNVVELDRRFWKSRENFSLGLVESFRWRPASKMMLGEKSCVSRGNVKQGREG